MQIQVNDEVGQDILAPEEVQALVAHVLEGEQAPGEAVVCVSFVDVETIHGLNRDYRGIDRPTDVLSFNMDDPQEWDDEDDECDEGASGDGELADEEPCDGGDPDGEEPGEDDACDDETFEDACFDDELMLGDIIVCPEVVRGQAEGFGNSVADEMRLLLAHGALHLMGYDHEEQQEAEEMEALERRYLAAFADAPAEELNVGPTVDHAAEGTAARPPHGAGGACAR